MQGGCVEKGSEVWREGRERGGGRKREGERGREG
jgi:hypothetical protein